jgi:hypothetical protein
VVDGIEVLDGEERAIEAVLLGFRLAEGLASAGLDPDAVAALVADGLVAPDVAVTGRVVLTAAGRPLADHVARVLVTAGAGPATGCVAFPRGS